MIEIAAGILVALFAIWITAILVTAGLAGLATFAEYYEDNKSEFREGVFAWVVGGGLIIILVLWTRSL